MKQEFLGPRTEIAVRTLLAAGYTITDSHRQPRHIELHCKRKDMLGASLSYLIAITDSEQFSGAEIDEIRHTANVQCEITVMVAREPGDMWISWRDFLEALGGAVPNWQALSTTYEQSLLTAANNILPFDSEGEAWLVFEDLVASGFEFILGRRVRRLGGRKRGKPVSDLQAQIPEGLLVVIDAKAAGNGFDATWSELRPLVEYVKRQRQRQQGHLELLGAIIVSSGFRQADERLSDLSREFYGETRVEVSFVEAGTLGGAVNLLRENVDIRNAIRWSKILIGGKILLSTILEEVKSARSERISNED